MHLNLAGATGKKRSHSSEHPGGALLQGLQRCFCNFSLGLHCCVLIFTFFSNSRGLSQRHMKYANNVLLQFRRPFAVTSGVCTLQFGPVNLSFSCAHSIIPFLSRCLIQDTDTRVTPHPVGSRMGIHILHVTLNIWWELEAESTASGNSIKKRMTELGVQCT